MNASLHEIINVVSPQMSQAGSLIVPPSSNTGGCREPQSVDNRSISKVVICECDYCNCFTDHNWCLLVIDLIMLITCYLASFFSKVVRNNFATSVVGLKALNHLCVENHQKVSYYASHHPTKCSLSLTWNSYRCILNSCTQLEDTHCSVVKQLHHEQRPNRNEPSHSFDQSTEDQRFPADSYTDSGTDM